MRILTSAAVAVVLAGTAFAGETPSPEGAEVYFIGLEDGAELTNPVTLRFGLKGMGIAPAGYDVDDTGHHHLLINVSAGDVDMNEPLAATDGIRHFGKGQTQVTMDLPPGTHTLQLLLGDYSHIPHDPPVVSAPVTITVK